nr:envelope glycoprotein L [Mastomys natalensis cytomegalovirus 3]WEG69933.1 envelope glycoprotein L [Mastomys natalensis cytomegalovirus 3]WEG70073.1 envelope glycoprotein L [Mastomys natalensis cytomegalovirus 3]WEG70213.1 envelope glycoprotein L [Mastomys natalensis cytomegalovirus 3]WEG70353.1 envelope glycoprotein L [Mastomys natalensis cytomegalovirus 3]
MRVDYMIMILILHSIDNITPVSAEISNTAILDVSDTTNGITEQYSTNDFTDVTFTNIQATSLHNKEQVHVTEEVQYITEKDVHPTKIDKSPTVIYILPRIISPNVTVVETECNATLYRCREDQNFSTHHNIRPLHPNQIRYSNLIRFVRQPEMLSSPIEINDDFLEQLTLLYNNEDQLRVLLTLLRSKRQKDWLSFLGGYLECDLPHSTIFTCVNDTCTYQNLLELNYTNDIFSENVLGLDVSPPSLSVLVYLRNNNTNTEAVIRVPTTSMSLLDATYNLMHTILQNTHENDFIKILHEYRNCFPALFPSSELSKLTRHRKKQRTNGVKRFNSTNIEANGIAVNITI